MNTKQLRANIAFAKWLEKNDPFLFKVAVERAKVEKSKSAGVAGLFDIDWADLGKTVIDTVQKTAPAVIQYQTQAKLLKLNMERARQGMPPVNSGDYAPTVNIAPQITPESEAAINRMAQRAVSSTGDQLRALLPWIIGGVAGVVLLPKLVRR